MNKIYVDRIEHNKIVCCFHKIVFDLPIEIMPDANEGDVFIIEKIKDDSVKNEAEKLINKLFE